MKLNRILNEEAYEVVYASYSGSGEGEDIDKIKAEIDLSNSIGTVTGSLGIETLMGTFAFRMNMILEMYGALAALMRRKKWLIDRIIFLKRIIAGEGGMPNDYFAGMTSASMAWDNNYGKRPY